MPSLLPTIYRQASAYLSDDSTYGRYSERYACGAIEKAIKLRNEERNENLSPKPYISFMFQVYAPKLYVESTIWETPCNEMVNPRKFGLLFLANLLESGMRPKDFYYNENEL